jgi:Uncharacterized conserved protein
MVIKMAILVLNFYQKHASKRLRMSCRYSPSCSEYAKIAILKHGVIWGSAKSIHRILRCRPPKGGIDFP